MFGCPPFYLTPASQVSTDPVIAAIAAKNNWSPIAHAVSNPNHMHVNAAKRPHHLLVLVEGLE